MIFARAKCAHSLCRPCGPTTHSCVLEFTANFVVVPVAAFLKKSRKHAVETCKENRIKLEVEEIASIIAFRNV